MPQLFFYRNLYKSQRLLSVGDAPIPILPVLAKDGKDSDVLNYDIRDESVRMHPDSDGDYTFVIDESSSGSDSFTRTKWNYFVGAVVLVVLIFVAFNRCYYARRTRRRLRRVIQAIATRRVPQM